MRHINIDRKKDMPNVIPVKSNNNKLGYIGMFIILNLLYY